MFLKFDPCTNGRTPWHRRLDTFETSSFRSFLSRKRMADNSVRLDLMNDETLAIVRATIPMNISDSVCMPETS